MSEYIVYMSGDWSEKLTEIVRCRDCAKFSEQEPGGEIGICNLGLEDTGLVSIVEPDGFCAWGEWKTNGQDAER